MSLDIVLIDRSTGSEIRSMNWLRNPFGLEFWAESNTRLGETSEVSLWDVCNRWAYGKAALVDRDLFYRTVKDYHAYVEDLVEGRFWFNESAWRQFITGESGGTTRSVEQAVIPHTIERERLGHRELGIIMEVVCAMPEMHLGPRFTGLSSYQAWFRELVEFATRLREDRHDFCCTN